MAAVACGAVQRTVGMKASKIMIPSTKSAAGMFQVANCRRCQGGIGEAE